MKREILVGSVVGLAIYTAYKSRAPVKVYYVDRLPMGYNAMTVPPIGIFIRKDHRDNNLLLQHEQVHWKQFLQNGLVPYYAKYFYEMVKYGYDHSPMEMDARFMESESCKNNYTACVRSGLARTIYDPDFRK